MKFSTAKFEPGGGFDGLADEVWAYALINIETGEPGASRPSIRVDIPREFSSDTTLGEWRETFRVAAVEALRVAADALEANEWPELHRISIDNEDRYFEDQVIHP